MARRGVRTLLAMGLVTAMLGGCTNNPPVPAPALAARPLVVSNTLSSTERQDLYHLPEGSEYLPLSLLRALNNSATKQPFLSTPERYGLLADPDNSQGLPVGMAMQKSTQGLPFAVAGFNCAACHVGEFTYQGTALRVDGAPNLFNLGVFVVELVGSIESTLHSPDELIHFLARFAQEQKPGISGESELSVLRSFYDEDALPADDEQARAKVQQLIQKHLGDELAGAPQGEAPYTQIKSDNDLDSIRETLQFLKAHVQFLKRLGSLKSDPAAGPGRLDAFGGARALVFPESAMTLTAPVRFPFLWGFQQQRWLHYDGNTNSITQRNIGQTLGLGAVALTNYSSTIQPRNLGTLETLAGKLSAPAWPEAVFGKPDPVSVEEGRKLFATHCQQCHSAASNGETLYSVDKLGTDENRAQTFAVQLTNGQPFSEALQEMLTQLEKKSFADHRLTPEEIQALEPTPPKWRTTGAYTSRPLNGIWAAPPYLHNGSIPTLWALLSPEEERPKCFKLGGREYDPRNLGYAVARDSSGCSTRSGDGRWFDATLSGNRNTGHMYGTHLPEARRRQLLEYLKSL